MSSTKPITDPVIHSLYAFRVTHSVTHKRSTVVAVVQNIHDDGRITFSINGRGSRTRMCTLSADGSQLTSSAWTYTLFVEYRTDAALPRN